MEDATRRPCAPTYWRVNDESLRDYVFRRSVGNCCCHGNSFRMKQAQPILTHVTATYFKIHRRFKITAFKQITCEVKQSLCQQQRSEDVEVQLHVFFVWASA